MSWDEEYQPQTGDIDEFLYGEVIRLRKLVADLEALNTELVAAADMARICLKNRDQNDLETKALVALRAAIAKAKEGA